MSFSRGLVALGLAAWAGALAASCGGDDHGKQAGTGGAPGSGGGGADAGPDLCGNQVVDPGEDCDDGNTNNQDGCDARCRYTCEEGVTGDALCSDGVFCNGAEKCGPDHLCHAAEGAAPDGTLCGGKNTCQAGVCKPAPPYCGDRIVVPGEECDPPDGDGCDPQCRFTCLSTDSSRNCAVGDVCAGNPKCEDSTHTCHGTPLPDRSPCGPNGRLFCVGGVCTDLNCGNKQMDPGEECDDGNDKDGDGCDHCQFSCKPDDPSRDCSSSDPCLNDATCDTGTHKCGYASPKPGGIACGDGQNCVEGNCLDTVCGDSIVALGVEACDDGNLIDGDGCDNDCTVTCLNAAADCTGVPPCRFARCANNKCVTAPNADDDGNPCTTSIGTATCSNGACTSGTCGNGTQEGGEECDLGAANGPNAGCEAGCTLSCSRDADCDDGDMCNGTETCAEITGGKRCVPGTPRNDGASCAPGRLCLNGGCHLAFCGDGYTDFSANEQCDPPNSVGCNPQCQALSLCNTSGGWAAKVVFQTTYGDGAALMTMSGEVRVWALLILNQSSTSLALTGSLGYCGLVLPDFQSGAATGSEWYGLTFPDAIFDHTSGFPITGSISNRAPGAVLRLDSTALLLGLTMDDPLGAWPSWDDLTNRVAARVVDTDADGHPGVTALAKTGTLPTGGASYSYPIVGIGESPYGRAKEFYLAIRAITQEVGHLDSCNTASGVMTVSAVDDHVVACKRTDDRDCDPTVDVQVADAVKPVYQISSATFSAKRLTGTNPTCADVRAAMP